MSRSARIRSALAAFAILAATPAIAAEPHEHATKVGDLEIIHPWSRATPGGAKVAGGYLDMANRGGKADRLISATAEVAGKVEIHESTMKDGVMGMRHLMNGIELAPGATVALKPGSYHLMLMNLKRPLKQGETFTGTLTFRDAGTVDIVFSVEGTGAAAPVMPPEHHDGHGHMGH
jgi:copper(I)-binding protein